MQDNDLNIEDFKEIFLKSIFRETVSTQEISDYFEFESVKFMDRFSNENHTQRIKDIIFKKFINGIEEANTNLSNPFIEHEQKRTWDILEMAGNGIDISEIEKPSRYNNKIPLPYLCKNFGFGIHIELEQIEFIYQGFELFKQQHEEDSNKPTPPATQQSKPIKEKPVISFKTMFENPLEYDKVLGYISEYLTDTNQWTGTIIYLSAFYGVLRDRGYLNKIYKAPQINSALKSEFSIEPTTTDKNFQDAEINYAVGLYADAFNMIPSIKSIK